MCLYYLVSLAVCQEIDELNRKFTEYEIID